MPGASLNLGEISLCGLGWQGKKLTPGNRTSLKGEEVLQRNSTRGESRRTESKENAGPALREHRTGPVCHAASYLFCPIDGGELDEVFDADEAVPIPVQGIEYGSEAGAVLRTPRGLAR